MHARPLAALTTLSAILLPSAVADVLVVDDDGGPGIIQDLQLAATLAGEGDILLVKSGTYGPLVLDKGLTIVADDGADVTVGRTQVLGLEAQQTAILSGLRVVADATAGGPDLLVEDCAGLVRLEGLDLPIPPPVGSAPLHTPQIVVRNSQQVRLVESLVGGTAAPGALPNPEPQPALVVESSKLNVHECYLSGSDGVAAGVDPFTLLGKPAVAGAPGVAMLGGGGYLRLANSVVVGGAGGQGALTTSIGCVAPSDGGHAVFIDGFAQSIVTAASTLVGGAAGEPARDASTFQCPATADDGDPIGQSPTAGIGYQDLPEPRPTLAAPRVVREDQVLTIGYGGVPGEPALWAIGLDPVVDLPAFVFPGVPLEVDPLVVLTLAPVGPNGTGTASYPALGDALPPGQGIQLYQQIARLPFSGVSLGEFATTVLVDSSL